MRLYSNYPLHTIIDRSLEWFALTLWRHHVRTSHPTSAVLMHRLGSRYAFHGDAVGSALMQHADVPHPEGVLKNTGTALSKIIPLCYDTRLSTTRTRAPTRATSAWFRAMRPDRTGMAWVSHVYPFTYVKQARFGVIRGQTLLTHWHSAELSRSHVRVRYRRRSRVGAIGRPLGNVASGEGPRRGH